MDLSNCITDEITTCNNDNMRLNPTCFSFLMVFPYFVFFSNINEIANFANKIIGLSDHEIKRHVKKLLFGTNFVVFDT